VTDSTTPGVRVGRKPRAASPASPTLPAAVSPSPQGLPGGRQPADLRAKGASLASGDRFLQKRRRERHSRPATCRHLSSHFSLSSHETSCSLFGDADISSAVPTQPTLVIVPPNSRSGEQGGLSVYQGAGPLSMRRRVRESEKSEKSETTSAPLNALGGPDRSLSGFITGVATPRMPRPRGLQPSGRTHTFAQRRRKPARATLWRRATTRRTLAAIAHCILVLFRASLTKLITRIAPVGCDPARVRRAAVRTGRRRCRESRLAGWT